MRYRIVAWSDLYNGQWCVIRLNDMRLIRTFAEPYTALRWLKTLHPPSSGQELSWRAKERLADNDARMNKDSCDG